MRDLQNIVPKDIFKEIVEGLRTTYNCTVTQTGGITFLHFNAIGLFRGNYVSVDCGAMQGSYMIEQSFDNRIGVRYSGAATTGTVKTSPFFQWGNLKDGKLDIEKLNEFPLIYMILPTPYEVNVEKNVMYYIDHTFQFLIINRTGRNQGDRTFTDSVFDNTVKDMSDIAHDLIMAIEKSKYMLSDTSFRRSEEIPFGITFSGDSGSTETLITDAAGCYVEASVKIRKKYC